MTDTPIFINVNDFAEAKYKLVICVQADGPFVLFPIGITYPAGTHSISASSDGDGNITFQADDEPSSEPLMSLFCFVDGVLTVTSDAAFKVTSAEVFADDGSKVPDGAKIYGENVGVSGKSVELRVQQNRSIARVLVNSSCQISFDFIQDGSSFSSFGVTIDHLFSDQEGNYANVYFERHKDGVWLPESRAKIGFFDLTVGDTYVANFVVLPEERSDEWSSTVKVSITNNGNTKVMRGIGRVSPNQVTKVIARESGAGARIGAYEIQTS